MHQLFRLAEVCGKRYASEFRAVLKPAISTFPYTFCPNLKLYSEGD